MRPSIGLALGAGGARGFAHVGVLDVLAKSGLKIDAIAGSSMGGIAAAFYACGVDIRVMEGLATQLKRRHLLDFTVPKLGFIAGDRIEELLRLVTRERTFAETNIPLAVVATELESGRQTIFRDGPIYEAVRASISIPGIFVPKRIGDHLYMDGGVVARLPIEAVRSLGVDVVIAVDVGAFDSFPPVRSIFDVILQSIDIMDRELTKTRVGDADVVVRPRVSHISSTAFTQIEECIEAGREAARSSLPLIHECLRTLEGSDFVGPQEACGE